MAYRPMDSRPMVRRIEESQEARLDVGEGVSLWYRTWGNPQGIPVLFVHGGPGQAIVDYKNGTAKFFDAEAFMVVEVDQRGTGLSRPSVRDDFRNMQHYLNLDIAMMSADFELVREALGISRWLVFGGSWGSTLGLDYAERYPACCLGLILRGIFLSTLDEFNAIYSRRPFLDNARRLAEFETFFELAAREAERRGEPALDPDDSERFVRLYEALIVAGDREAAWRFYAFESNLMEEDPAALLDPHRIDEGTYPEAQSVAFFEARLFLRHTFEAPLDLLGAVPSLLKGHGGAPVRTWVVQGTGDEVCPEVFAQRLVDKLAEAGVPHDKYFVDAGHKATSDGIATALQRCVREFLAAQATGAQPP